MGLVATLSVQRSLQHLDGNSHPDQISHGHGASSLQRGRFPDALAILRLPQYLQAMSVDGVLRLARLRINVGPTNGSHVWKIPRQLSFPPLQVEDPAVLALGRLTTLCGLDAVIEIPPTRRLRMPLIAIRIFKRGERV